MLLSPSAWLLGLLGIARMGGDGRVIELVGFALLIGGIAIRWAAICTLGNLFTGVVTIKREHQLIRRGLYRNVRHPAYTGLLIAHFGLGHRLSRLLKRFLPPRH